MPKYGIHHIVLNEAVTQLKVSGHAAGVSAAAIIDAERASAVIGSIGPDLFFWGTDYEYVDKLYTLYENIEEVVEIYNSIVQPIRDVINAVGEPVEDLVETLAPNTVELIKRVLEEIRETASLFKSAISTQLLAGVLEVGDFFSETAKVGPLAQQFFQLYVPDLQSNKPEDDWYWFDMLHYRHTGEFAAKLVKNAQTNRQKAFAFGYISHIATDIAGHPFVNQVCGSTYRMNVWRHVTAENFMDTWKFAQYYTDTDGNGESINQTLLSHLNIPEALPSDIGDLLYQCFIDTYGNYPHPTNRLPGGFYTREDIDKTYEVFYKVLKFMEDQAVKRPEEPFSGVGDVLSDALDAFRPPPAPPSSSSAACSWEDILSFGITESSRECYENFFEEVETWLDYLGELLEWTIETLRNLIDLLLALLLSLPISVLLAILYGIQLLCYELYRNARMVLSTMGFVFPEPYELNTSIARNLITPTECFSLNFKAFPSIGKPARTNLVCPVTEAEQPSTAAGFHPGTIDATPERFISIEPFDVDHLAMYSSAGTPTSTLSLEHDRLTFGNATDLTAWMIENANDPTVLSGTSKIYPILYTNWNLDADRGYGYKDWKGDVPQDIPYVVSNESYKTED